MGTIQVDISQDKKISISSFNHCQDNKMMFTGLTVLSVVLVCSNVFSGCVAQDQDTLPEEFETLSEEFETLSKEFETLFKEFETLPEEFETPSVESDTLP